jgi:hypothetical protein
MASYSPVGDYPIRPKRGAGVRIKDRFWGPKILTNTEVTIPFEAQKFEQADREFGVNVLEAAITSLWSSSQVSADMAHHIDFADAGRQHYDDKDFPRRVRAIRAF